MPLRELLTERPGVPVYVENDASCAALAEAFDATASSTCPNLVMFTVGTGVGGGWCSTAGSTAARRARRPRSATRSIGLDLERRRAHARASSSRSPGSLETLASGRALDRLAERAAAQEPDSFLGKRLEQDGEVTATTWSTGAKAGDADALRVLRRARRAARHRDRQRDQHVRPAGGRDRRRRLARGRPAAGAGRAARR